jgi:hypothetical protein
MIGTLPIAYLRVRQHPFHDHNYFVADTFCLNICFPVS